MNLLLDTHVFIWLAIDASRISKPARVALETAGNTVFLSSISVWEIEQKYRSGKLKLPVEPQRLIAEFYEKYDIGGLPFHEDAAFMLEKLPRLHTDPFDRMLVCQAIHHGMVVISGDRHIHQYPVKTIW